MREEPRAEKIKVVEDLRKKIEETPILILTQPKGLTVKQVSELKRRLRTEGAEYRQMKNTLTQRAFALLGKEEIKEHLKEEVAILFGGGDAVSAAKVLTNFAKEFAKPAIKAGLMEGNFISSDRIIELSKLPTREVLIAKVVYGIAAPLSGLVTVLQGTIRNLVYVLEAIRKDKEKKGPAKDSGQGGEK